MGDKSTDLYHRGQARFDFNFNVNINEDQIKLCLCCYKHVKYDNSSTKWVLKIKFEGEK